MQKYTKSNCMNMQSKYGIQPVNVKSQNFPDISSLSNCLDDSMVLAYNNLHKDLKIQTLNQLAK